MRAPEPLRALLPALFLAIGLVAPIRVDAQAPSPDGDPLLAAWAVYGQVAFMRAQQGYCAKVDPSSSAAIEIAMKDWMTEHSDLYSKAIHMLEVSYTTEEFREFDKGMDSDNAQSAAEMDELPLPSRVSTCRAFQRSISSERFSLMRFSSAIESFGK
jgi:hypothetical protein